ncbi:MAG: hypothetical protein FJW26_13880 [Acidimicrobiia bacterium]|nr:hypothetical protein [Acidimicrobiia bacterium]
MAGAAGAAGGGAGRAGAAGGAGGGLNTGSLASFVRLMISGARPGMIALSTPPLPFRGTRITTSTLPRFSTSGPTNSVIEVSRTG